jgi:hypothetical protein
MRYQIWRDTARANEFLENLSDASPDSNERRNCLKDCLPRPQEVAQTLINPFILISSGFSCPYWVSFKQAKGKGGRIKKGEIGFPVVFWKWIEVQDTEADSGKKRVPFLRYYTVFNPKQTDGRNRRSIL